MCACVCLRVILAAWAQLYGPIFIKEYQEAAKVEIIAYQKKSVEDMKIAKAEHHALILAQQAVLKKVTQDIDLGKENQSKKKKKKEKLSSSSNSNGSDGAAIKKSRTSRYGSSLNGAQGIDCQTAAATEYAFNNVSAGREEKVISISNLELESEDDLEDIDVGQEELSALLKKNKKDAAKAKKKKDNDEKKAQRKAEKNTLKQAAAEKKKEEKLKKKAQKENENKGNEKKKNSKREEVKLDSEEKGELEENGEEVDETDHDEEDDEEEEEDDEEEEEEDEVSFEDATPEGYQVDEQLPSLNNELTDKKIMLLFSNFGWVCFLVKKHYPKRTKGGWNYELQEVRADGKKGSSRDVLLRNEMYNSNLPEAGSWVVVKKYNDNVNSGSSSSSSD